MRPAGYILVKVPLQEHYWKGHNGTVERLI